MVRDFTQRFLPVWQSAVSLPVHETDALASVRETEAQLEHAHEIRLGSNRVVSRRAYSQNCDVSPLMARHLRVCIRMEVSNAYESW